MAAIIYIVTHEQQKERLYKANSDDEIAKLVVWATENRVKNMALIRCSCCDHEFLDGEYPRAFLVHIPMERYLQKANVTAGAICAVCKKRDDQWLVENGLQRLGSLYRPRWLPAL